MRKSGSPKSTKSASAKPKSRRSKKDSASTRRLSAKAVRTIAGVNSEPASAAPTGARIGTKRSDLRFRAPDGSEWASPFEYKVFAALTEKGITVRKTTPEDALKYDTPVKNGFCTGVHVGGSVGEIVQERKYTPDLQIVLNDGPGNTSPSKLIYLETKGYFPGPKRNLFKQARSQHPELDIRLVASSDHWVTKGKTRLSDWAKRFRIPFAVWDGKLPDDWLK